MNIKSIVKSVATAVVTTTPAEIGKGVAAGTKATGRGVKVASVATFTAVRPATISAKREARQARRFAQKATAF